MFYGFTQNTNIKLTRLKDSADQSFRLISSPKKSKNKNKLGSSKLENGLSYLVDLLELMIRINR